MNKKHSISTLFLLFFCYSVYSQKTPFNIHIEPMNLNGIGGLQSFAFAQYDGKWILIGGRLDGLHRRQPFAAFDVAGNNNQILVVDPASQQKWSAPLSTLSISMQEQLSSTNMEFFQDGDHLYIVGALFLVYTIAFGGLDTGWTFYTPYSTQTSTSVIAAVFGAFILGMASILTGVNFIVTVHKMRAPGMTWVRMPLFVWAIYATSVIQVLATPVVGVTLILVAIERLLGIGIFDSNLGGDPILFQNFFWFYSHPAVYIMILPAFGIMSELITIHSRKSIFGYKAVAISSIGIAVIGFFVWGHHMFTSGQSALATVFFSILTYGVAVPTAIKVFSWVATLYKGSISFTTPMCYAFVFLFLFLIGGLTGIFLGSLSTDVHLHNTYFVVAHFHYVMMGGTIIAWIGGVYHWWPKITGKKFSQTWGNISAVVVFIGFNLTFFPQFIMGSRGMPRRYYDYLPEYYTFHVLSTIGSYVLSIGLFIVLFNWIHSIFYGENETKTNPWKGKSMEWTETAVVPIEHNFEQQPISKHGPYEFDELVKPAKAGGH